MEHSPVDVDAAGVSPEGVVLLPKNQKKPPRPLKKQRKGIVTSGMQALLLAEGHAFARVPAILNMLTTIDARSLRVTSKAFLVIVSEHSWADTSTKVSTGISKWRACFPNAAAVSVSLARLPKDFCKLLCGVREILSTHPLDLLSSSFAAAGDLVNVERLTIASSKDADAVFAALKSGDAQHLRKLRASTESYVTNDTFALFRRLRVLQLVFHSVSLSSPPSIEGFRHLACLSELSLLNTGAEIHIDDTMLSALPNLEILYLRGFSVDATGACFSVMHKIRSVNLFFSVVHSPSFLQHLPCTVDSVCIYASTNIIWQPVILSFGALRRLEISRSADLIPVPAWTALRGLKVLVVEHAGARVISDEALAQLVSLEVLYLTHTKCSLTDVALSGMPNLRKLILSNLRGTSRLSEAAFMAVPLLEILCIDFSDVRLDGDPAVTFSPLLRLHHLSVAGLPWVMDSIISALPSLAHLDVCFCENITAAGFPAMRRLDCLSMSYCERLPLTDETLSHLTGLSHLELSNCVKSEDRVGLTAAGWMHLKNIPYLDVTGNTIPQDALRHLWEGDHMTLHAPRVLSVTQLAAAKVRSDARAVLEGQKRNRLKAVRAERVERGLQAEAAKTSRAVQRELAELQRDAESAAQDAAVRSSRLAQGTFADTSMTVRLTAVPREQRGHSQSSSALGYYPVEPAFIGDSVRGTGDVLAPPTEATGVAVVSTSLSLLGE